MTITQPEPGLLLKRRKMRTYLQNLTSKSLWRCPVEMDDIVLIISCKEVITTIKTVSFKDYEIDLYHPEHGVLKWKDSTGLFWSRWEILDESGR